MKLDVRNSQYIKHATQWERCRDVIAGQDAVHAAGSKYLSMLSGQNEEEYQAYKRRATLFNAAARTLDALSGMIFSAAPRVTLPPAMSAWASDITLDGTSLTNLAKSTVEDLISVGRVGIIVEHPANELDGITVGAAEAMNLRPYLRKYTAESIHDWRTGSVNGAIDLTMVKLHETIDSPSGEFETSKTEQYRVLDLFEGAYRVRLYQKSKAGEWALIGENFPTKNGQVLNYIPFVIINTACVGADIEKPPLLDLVDHNLAHYRNTADFEHGLHFTGLPTPVVSGVQLDEGQKLTIGSGSAWVFPDPAARATYLEFTGAGLTQLADAIAAKEKRMAVLGARMLDEMRRGAESTRTTQIKHTGEFSALASLAQTASEGLRIALNYMADWAAIRGQIVCELNTQYGIESMNPQELTALVGAWQAGAISKRSLFAKLQSGHVIADGVVFEDEQEQIDEAGPELAPQADEPEVEEAQTVLQRIRDRLGV